MRLALLPFLLILACTSPVLTFAALWQTKEWRIDRLTEHFRTEGWLRQLFGVVRPAIVAVSPLVLLVPGVRIPWWTAGIVLLAAASLAQIVSGRQHMPRRTMKAMILVVATLALSVVAGIALLAQGSPVAILLPLLTPFFFALVWALFLPVDRLQKQTILRRAERLRQKFPDAVVIGITGSVGKTTTKELIAHALRGASTVATPSYVNSEMGVANWLLKELPRHDVKEELIIIVEMGAYKTGEIATLCRICRPQMGVLTFIGSQHIALFGSQKQLIAAKSELLESLPESGCAFLNADCELCGGTTINVRSDIRWVGTGGHADLEAFDIEETGSGIRFRVRDVLFELPLHGTHNTTNALLAIAVCERMGLSLGAIALRLKSFTPLSSTFAVRKERGVTLLDDTHNSSAASFRAAIAWAKSQPAEKKVLVTPGIIELGDESETIHTQLGAASADIIDRVIFTTQRGREAFETGFGKPVELWGKNTSPVPAGSLLLCIGRISSTIIEKLLPH